MTIFPTINAALNLSAALFLLCGWRAIRRRDQRTHKKFMILAMGASSLFLASYLIYHTVVQRVTPYTGEGVWRFIYFFILGTHTPLAVIIVPSCLIALRHALKGDFIKHTRITRWLLPVWLYVSMTGVLIYVMLYVF